MYTITITETVEGEENRILRYSQSLEAINLNAIIAAVNTKPPRVRNRPSRAKVAVDKTYTVSPKKAAPTKSDADFLTFKEEAK